MKDKVICAIDSHDLEYVKFLIYELKDHIGAIKLGMEFFCSNGPKGIEEISKLGMPIMLDLKLHEMPSVVKSAIKAILPLNVIMITLHISGGSDMLKTAVATVNEYASRDEMPVPLLLGVTTLTNFNENDIHEIGINDALDSYQVRMAGLASEAGLDGFVCSTSEIHSLRSYFPEKKIVVSGVRPEGASKDDHKHTMDPKAALEKGADYIIIGRPITKSEEPAVAANQILMSI